MIGTFSSFSLPQISTVARRTALGALCVGVVALVGLALLDYALVGLGITIGLAMALGNFRLIQAATVKATRSEREDKRRPLAFNTLGRMGAITVVALGLVFLSRPLGFGVLLGLALFQFMLLTNVVMAMLKEAKSSSALSSTTSPAPVSPTPSTTSSEGTQSSQLSTSTGTQRSLFDTETAG
jgi:hypothetical protein